MRLLRGIQVARGVPTISHMFFADDSYIFCKAISEDAIQVIKLLQTFEKASGQKINKEKSSIFFSRNTATEVRQDICNILGFAEATENAAYLGLPNILGRKKSAVLGYLKEHVKKG